MSLLDESVSVVTLTADTERPHLPEPQMLCGDLLPAGRGYFDRAYLNAVNRVGGRYVVRASVSVNPMVRARRTCLGERS